MAITNKDMNITLTNESAKSFVEKLKNTNPDIIRKRDKFLKDSSEKIKVVKTNISTTIILDIKEKH